MERSSESLKGRSFLSLGPVRVQAWTFKSSVLNGNILIIAYNELFCYTTCKFFQSDESAKDWIEYLVLQTDSGVDNEDSSG